MVNCTYCNGTKEVGLSGACEWCNIPYPSQELSVLYTCYDLYWHYEKQVEYLRRKVPELEPAISAIGSLSKLHGSLNQLASSLKEYPNTPVTDWCRALPPQFHHLAFGLPDNTDRLQTLIALRRRAEDLVKTECPDLMRIVKLVAEVPAALPPVATKEETSTSPSKNGKSPTERQQSSTAFIGWLRRLFSGRNSDFRGSRSDSIHRCANCGKSLTGLIAVTAVTCPKCNRILCLSCSGGGQVLSDSVMVVGPSTVRCPLCRFNASKV